MEKVIDFKKIEWVNKPKRCIQESHKLVIETEPKTSLNLLGGSAEAVELQIKPKGNFCFTIRTDFEYKETFDQCGIILYDTKGRKTICGCEKMDGAVSKLVCRVYHVDGTDRSEREIGSAIQWMYYRVWLRGGIVRIQYSFNGERYSDLREFKTEDTNIQIGIYACSVKDSSFDVTFSQAILNEEGE